MPTAAGGLRLMGERIVLRNLVPPRSVGPFAGTLKLTAPDGTVTEYQAEFTPDPAPEPAAKSRSGVGLDASVGPAKAPPAESAEIRRERAEVRIRAARAQLELMQKQAERAETLRERGVGSIREMQEATARLAAARAALEEAELDRRAAGERIEADRRRRAAGAAAAEARLRVARAKLQVVEAEVGAVKQDVARLETQVENGERPEIDLLAARNRLTVARRQAEAVRAEIELTETAGRVAAESFGRAAGPSDEMPELDALRKEIAELRALVERLRSEDGER